MSATGSVAFGAIDTWTGGGATPAWNLAGNWTPAVPSTSDTALFNSPLLGGSVGGPANPVVVDSGRTVQFITFDTANVGNYVIGSTGGQALLLSSAGSITMTPTVTANQTINAPLTLLGTTGVYSLINNSSAAALAVGGAVTPFAPAGVTTLVLSGTSTTANTFSGVLNNGVSPSTAVLALTKSGGGTWTLNNNNLSTGATTVAASQLVLDYAAGATSVINSGSALTFGALATANSNTLTVAGKANTANTLSFAGFTTTAGAGHLNLTTAGTGTTAVNLGTISATLRTSGSSLDINLPAGTSATTTSANTTAGVLPQVITLNGTTFAANDGTGNIVGYNAYTANPVGSSATFGGTGKIIDMVNPNTTITGDTNNNGIRFNTPAASTITVNGGRFLAIGGGNGNGAILVTQNVGGNLSRITGGLLQGVGSRDLTIIQNNTNAGGDLQIDSVVTDFQTSTMILNKAGAGRVILNGLNTYTNNTYLNEGTLVVTADPTTGNTQAGITVTAATKLATGVNTAGLFVGQRVTGTNVVASGSQFITAIDSVNGTVTLSGAVGGTGAVTFGDSGGLGTKTGAGAVLIGNSATLQIGNGGTTGGLVAGQSITNGGTVAFNRSDAALQFGNVISGVGGVAQVGTGRTTLLAANTYTGVTTVSAGTLALASSGSIAASNAIDVKAGAAFDVSAVSGFAIGTQQTLRGDGTVIGTTALNGTLAPGETGAGKLTFGNGLTLNTSALTFLDITGVARGTAGGYDAIDATTATLTYGGNLLINLTAPAIDGQTFALFQALALAGDFNSIAITGAYAATLTDAAGVWTGTAADGVTSFVFATATGTLTEAVVGVPEPTSLAAIGILAGLAMRRRRSPMPA